MGLKPLQPTLNAIAGISDRKELATYLGDRLRADVDAFNATDIYTDNLLGMWVAADLDEPTRYSPFLLQGGLDMPDRAYYIDESERMEKIRGAFRAHVANVLKLGVVKDAEARAGRVFDLERRMAEVHWNRTDTGDLAKGNNHWARADFSKVAPGMDWDAYFSAAGLGGQPNFVVWQPSAVTGLSALVAKEPLNAVNLPVLNAMNFPAAILQLPFFDPKRTVAMDYGAIGAVIGHEISHSFDDQGAKFDAEGRMRNWWTDADAKHFETAGAALARQYDAYKPFPDLAVNGKLTLGENIADVAGLAAAYDAYRISLGSEPAPVVDGMTGDQQFFLSYAQAWRGKTREPALRQQLLGDGHSPGRYRTFTVRKPRTRTAASRLDSARA